ncbi:Rv2175c family DNA-binding protein [Flaviflexus equikiangi]|uniref:DNA-binding protein n=1 Tax=Flaviflexus equikiangi TaxID=2758573 RepID=A0ABS2TGN3_9ACTO|nr:Rv2175c family DNA-binding protein [Flaviflexus equikiangi]MBM9433273.1 DNA-binding protein [Flaviflexus equikiangi]
MNSPLPDHLSIPEAAEALGIRLRDVRALISDRRLLATRRTGPLTVSSDQLIEVDGRYEVLGSLRGTLILLEDSGFSDSEAEEWLHRENPELGEAPIAALRSGKHRAVRRTIASLAF